MTVHDHEVMMTVNLSPFTRIGPVGGKRLTSGMIVEILPPGKVSAQ